MEAFFDFKWEFDRNQAIDDPYELALMDQIPIETQNKLYCEFLFSEFLSAFRDLFKIPKPDSLDCSF